jgi:hypothetical protein
MLFGLRGRSDSIRQSDFDAANVIVLTVSPPDLGIVCPDSHGRHESQSVPSLARMLLIVSWARVAMRKKHLVAAVAVIWVGVLVYLMSGATSLGRSYAEEANRRRLQNAVWAAEANYGGLLDAGYIQWTPTTVAQQLVEILNAAQVPLADDPSHREVKLPPAPRTKYVLGQPSGPWQVVLVADEPHQRVRVEGYGNDLEHPMMVKELVVMGY